MTRSQSEPRTHRAREILHAVGRAYPQAWAHADRIRGMRGGELPQWPEWCYLPHFGAYAIVSGGGTNRVPIERAQHPGIVAALAAWRMTQGIYRYNPALYAPLITTPITGELPGSLLYRLPEWCIYIETPGMVWPDEDGPLPIHGMWAHMDWGEASSGVPYEQLRLVLDAAIDIADPLDQGLVPVPITLSAGTLADALDRLVESGIEEGRKLGLEVPASIRQTLEILAPLISLILYLCADEAEIGGGARPANPVPKRTRRHGWRLFPADGLTTWDVGVRLGAALRRADEQEQTHTEDSATGRRVRGHIRRAHWHTFLTGPRDALQERRVKWLPPIAVNVDDVDALPTTVRKVQE